MAKSEVIDNIANLTDKDLKKLYRVNGVLVQRTCEICGKIFYVKKRMKDSTTCSRSCTRRLTDMGILSKDPDFYRRKNIERLARFKERTGYDNPASNPESKAKRRETLIEKYGDGDASTAFSKIAMNRVHKQAASNKIGSFDYLSKPVIESIMEAQEKIMGNPVHALRVQQVARLLSNNGYDVETHVVLQNKVPVDIQCDGIMLDIEDTFTHNVDAWYDDYRGYQSQASSPTVVHRPFSTDMAAMILQNGYWPMQVYDWQDDDTILSMVKKHSRVYQELSHATHGTNRNVSGGQSGMEPTNKESVHVHANGTGPLNGMGFNIIKPYGPTFVRPIGYDASGNLMFDELIDNHLETKDKLNEGYLRMYLVKYIGITDQTSIAMNQTSH